MILVPRILKFVLCSEGRGIFLFAEYEILLGL